MGDSKHQVLRHIESSYIAYGRKPAGCAMRIKLIAVIVMDQCLYSQQHWVPQRHYLQWNAFLHVRLSVEVMIATQAQVVMLFLNNMIENL